MQRVQFASQHLRALVELPRLDVPPVAGVPLASVQETTSRGLTVKTVEENEALRPRIPHTKTPDFLHTIYGVLCDQRGRPKGVGRNITNTIIRKGLLFFAPLLRESQAGMIKSSPQKCIAQGTAWRFLNQLKRELKG